MHRVLIVDDSPTSRDVLASIISSDDELEVVGFAENGRDAVAQVMKLHPDVITMDLNMPVMDGFEATKEIMIEAPTPIVVVSATSRNSEVDIAMQALRAGALNVLLKPVGPSSPNFEAMAKDVVNTVKAMAGVYVIRHRRQAAPVEPVAEAVAPESPRKSRIRAIAIVASTGGPPALANILGQLPSDFPTPILIVQHIAAGFVDGFVEWLNSVIDLTAKVAEDREALSPATVYIAPHDCHLGVSRGGRIQLSDAPPIDGFRPAGTHLYATVADAFGSSSVGVILTGMGDDGVEGLKKIHSAGGSTLAQNEESSVVFGMPRVAIESGVVDAVLPLGEISKSLMALVASCDRR